MEGELSLLVGDWKWEWERRRITLTTAGLHVGANLHSPSYTLASAEELQQVLTHRRRAIGGVDAQHVLVVQMWRSLMKGYRPQSERHFSPGSVGKTQDVYINANSEQERDQWINAIRHVIHRVDRSSGYSSVEEARRWLPRGLEIGAERSVRFQLQGKFYA